MPGPGVKFKPGHDIVSPGRPPIPEDVKEAKALNQVTVVRIFNELNHMTADELKERASDPKTTIFEHLVIAVLKKGVQMGDPNRAEFILNRIIGKPKESLEITVNPYTSKSVEELEEELERRRRLPPPT
jgi:hypothetical protein